MVTALEGTTAQSSTTHSRGSATGDPASRSRRESAGEKVCHAGRSTRASSPPRKHVQIQLAEKSTNLGIDSVKSIDHIFGSDVKGRHLTDLSIALGEIDGFTTNANGKGVASILATYTVARRYGLTDTFLAVLGGDRSKALLSRVSKSLEVKVMDMAVNFLDLEAKLERIETRAQHSPLKALAKQLLGISNAPSYFKPLKPALETSAEYGCVDRNFAPFLISMALNEALITEVRAQELLATETNLKPDSVTKKFPAPFQPHFGEFKPAV